MCWATDFQDTYLHDLVFKLRILLEGAIAESRSKQEKEMRGEWEKEMDENTVSICFSVITRSREWCYNVCVEE